MRRSVLTNGCQLFRGKIPRGARPTRKGGAPLLAAQRGVMRPEQRGYVASFAAL